MKMNWFTKRAGIALMAVVVVTACDVSDRAVRLRPEDAGATSCGHGGQCPGDTDARAMSGRGGIDVRSDGGRGGESGLPSREAGETNAGGSALADAAAEGGNGGAGVATGTGGASPVAGTSNGGGATSSGGAPGAAGGPSAGTCSDGAQNRDETDVDCGGKGCPGCSPGKRCSADADCAYGYACSANRCLLAVDQLAAGDQLTCAKLPDQRVACWGAYYSYGSGPPVSEIVPGLPATDSIAMGLWHTCARITEGTVRCWGMPAYGELGNGSISTTQPPYGPVAVRNLTDVVEIAAGGQTTMARTKDGRVYWWGSVAGGAANTPAEVSGVSNVDGLAVGSGHVCFLTSGTVYCAGPSNDKGQLGSTATGGTGTPTLITGLTSVIQLVAGSNHSCALLRDNTIRCWGDNTYGQLGNDAPGPAPNPDPVKTVGLGTAVQLAAGGDHTCARLANGKVDCWGYNATGQVGDGTIIDASHPVEVIGISGATDVAAGVQHTCTRLSDKTVRCWGDDAMGQLGDGTSCKATTPVATVPLVKSGTACPP